MYYAIHYVLRDTENPDRIAQSANSIVELLTYIPECLPDIQVQGHELEKDYYKGLLINIRNAIAYFTDHRANRGKGGIFDKKLTEALLIQLEKELDLFRDPERREFDAVATELIEQVVAYSDTPTKARKKKVEGRLKGQMIRLYRKANQIKHHRNNPTNDEFCGLLGELDGFLTELLSPIPALTTTEGLDEIDRIIQH